MIVALNSSSSSSSTTTTAATTTTTSNENKYDNVNETSSDTICIEQVAAQAVTLGAALG